MPDNAENENQALQPPSPPPRTPDSHGITPRTCNACGADATNYVVCPVCYSTDLTFPD